MGAEGGSWKETEKRERAVVATGPEQLPAPPRPHPAPHSPPRCTASETVPATLTESHPDPETAPGSRLRTSMNATHQRR